MSHRIIPLGLLVALLPTMLGMAVSSRLTSRASAAPDTAPYYFPETQHYLSGRFRQYWEEHGGLYVFGLPLTRTYYEVSTDGKTYLTQYFERSRFEYHPENAQPFDVLLTLLGLEAVAGQRGDPYQPTVDRHEPDGQYFPETQHNVDKVFLSFWQRWGGLQNFGYPVSEGYNAVVGQIYRVQYFERARFEYHPEFAGTDYEVLLGQLGKTRAWSTEAYRARDPEVAPPTGEFIPGGSTSPSSAPVAPPSPTAAPAPSAVPPTPTPQPPTPTPVPSAPRLTVSPSSGQAGTKFVISGTGFPAGASVGWAVGGGNSGAFQLTASQTAFDFTLSTDGMLPGTYPVTFSANGRAVGTITFTATAPPPSAGAAQYKTAAQASIKAMFYALDAICPDSRCGLYAYATYQVCG